MQRREVISLFSALRLWGENGKRAPHKPLLVLLAIGRCLRGEDRLISYSDFSEQWSDLFKKYGPPEPRLNPHYPFWRLRNDKVWEIPNDDRIKETDSCDAWVTSLRDENAQGGFPKEIHDTLTFDPELCIELASLLVYAHFPSSYHDDILLDAGIGRPALPVGESEIARIYRQRYRDPKFAPAVIKAYHYRCAVCEFSLKMKDSLMALEGAHIKWHAADGPDEMPNGLALCVLHHRLFDRGVFSLSDEHEVVVTESATGDSLNSALGKFEGKTIGLPDDCEYYPEPQYIDWHRRQVFKDRPTHTMALRK